MGFKFTSGIFMKKDRSRFLNYLFLGGMTLFLTQQGVQAKATHPVHGAVHNGGKVMQKPANSTLPVKGILDLSVLPVVQGTVAQYLPTPYGNLGGVLLTDGTQVLFSTMFGEIIKGFIHPGQTVEIRGLKAYSLPLLQAFMIINAHGDQVQEDSPDANIAPVPITGPDLYVNGVIKQKLYNLQGQVIGVVLNDKTVVYIRPSDIQRLELKLEAGQPLYAQGMGSTTALGKALQARTIGRSEETQVDLSQINAPPMGAPAGSPSYDYIPE